MALRQDGFEEAVRNRVARHGTRRIGLFLGTSTSGILRPNWLIGRATRQPEITQDFDYQRTQNVASLAGYLRQRLGIAGPSFVVSCACASTAKTFGCAARMIEAGICDAAVVGGATHCASRRCTAFTHLHWSARPVPAVSISHATVSPSVRPQVSLSWNSPMRILRAMQSCCSASARARCLSYVVATSRGHRSAAGYGTRIERVDLHHATSTTSTCTARRPAWVMRPRPGRVRALRQ